MSDLYALLGLDRQASPADIKKAYRKAALAHHPDHGGDKETFQKIQAAYDVLSDPDKRGHYDATGQIPSEDHGQGQQFPPDLSAMFGTLFGQGMPFFGNPFGGQPQQMKPERGPNKIHEIGVGLADLYRGKTFKLNMKREVLCSGCGGKGGSQVEDCRACNGKGIRMRGQQMGPIMTMMQEACGACAQTGQRVVTQCVGCAGKRVVERESVLDVIVEPGMQEGDRLTFAGQCSESPTFERPGDVILVIRAATTDSDKWVRRGADLVYNLQIDLAEALLGWERNLEGHPSGRPLHVVWKGGVIQEGEVLRVVGWGMPNRSGGLGDLHVVCSVSRTQEAWSEEQQRALRSVWTSWKEPVATEETVTPQR